MSVISDLLHEVVLGFESGSPTSQRHLQAPTAVASMLTIQPWPINQKWLGTTEWYHTLPSKSSEPSRIRKILPLSGPIQWRGRIWNANVWTHHLGLDPTKRRTPRAIRLWRFHFSTATATRRPPRNNILVSCEKNSQKYTTFYLILLGWANIKQATGNLQLIANNNKSYL